MDAPTPHHEIDRSIYPMPMFTTFRVRDLDVSRDWYVQALGFVELAVMPGEDGQPALVHLRRYRHQDVLLVPAPMDGDGPSATGEATGSSSVDTTLSLAFLGSAGELAAQADRARAMGTAVEGPTETPWFATEVVVVDPDGNRLVLTRRSDREVPQEWNDLVADAVTT